MLPELQNYYFKRDLLKNLLSQLSEEEIKTNIKILNKCVYWIIGHIAGARFSILKLLNINYDLNISFERFRKGSSGNYKTEWPEFLEILNHFNTMGELIFNYLDKNDSKLINEKMKYVINDETVTVGDNIKFLLFHEDYHIGQLGLILKLLDKNGIGV